MNAIEEGAGVVASTAKTTGKRRRKTAVRSSGALSMMASVGPEDDVEGRLACPRGDGHAAPDDARVFAAVQEGLGVGEGLLPDRLEAQP